MTRNEGMIRGEWGYFEHGAKLDNVFFFLLALKINFVIDELWTSSSDLPNNFKEYVFQSSQHLENYVVQLSSVSQIAPLSPTTDYAMRLTHWENSVLTKRLTLT